MRRIPRRPDWNLPDREATPESVFLGRRDFLRRMGGASGLALAGGSGLAAWALGCRQSDADPPPPAAVTGRLVASASGPARRNERFTLDRPLTDEQVAARYNNFYEFGTDKERVGERGRRFRTQPWSIEIAGLVQRPRTVAIEDLVRQMSMEERLYRFRCVEAWAMAVPWIGFAMRELVRFAEPLGSARFVRFVSFQRPDEAPGQREQPWYPWPYFEGLTMAEATNELALVATGIYGHDLPVQHGAPVRVVVPWKYGYKSIKSIVRVEFVRERPPTFWNTLAPGEYDFLSNVNPAVPHPRWSQASERVIGSEERRRTLPFNGYGEFVAGLYRG